MTSIDGGNPYSLSRTMVLTELADPEWFAKCMERFYVDTARRWGCAVEPSARRLLDASDFWMDDVERTIAFGIDREESDETSGDECEGAEEEKPLELDHFKHASILAFWLRRLVPINDTNCIDANGDIVGDAHVPNEKQRHFLLYGNELCALLAGFQIALNYELQQAEADDELSPQLSGRDGALRTVRLPRRFVYEYPRLLKHKNISPHAIYMTYRSLFDRFGWPQEFTAPVLPLSPTQ